MVDDGQLTKFLWNDLIDWNTLPKGMTTGELNVMTAGSGGRSRFYSIEEFQRMYLGDWLDVESD